ATLLARIAAFSQRPTPAEAQHLAATGDERALPALVAAMTDTMEGQDVVRYRQAVRTLASAELLQRWLGGDLESRRVAAHALTAHDPAHAPLIGLALRDADDQVRAIARRSLRAWTASPALHDLFRETLANPDPRVRLLAAEGLGKLGKPADLPALTTALEAETDSAARDRLAWAIERIEDDAEQ
ncbi:MAG TPA: HEAT repeat domain-containing protein, partial [Nannocystis sp.]